MLFWQQRISFCNRFTVNSLARTHCPSEFHFIPKMLPSHSVLARALSHSSMQGNEVDTCGADEPGQMFYFIRHGVTEANEALQKMPWGSCNFNDHALWDTVLSNAGIEEAIRLHLHWQLPSTLSVVPWGEVDLVLCSPLTRALQTFSHLVHHSHPPLLPPTVPRLVHPLLRERLYLSSDVGRPRSALESQFPDFDFQSLGDDDTPWWYTPDLHPHQDYIEWRPEGGSYLCPGEPVDVFRTRMQQLRAFLLTQRARRVVVVSHWGVIRGLTGADPRNCEVVVSSAGQLFDEPLIDP